MLTRSLAFRGFNHSTYTVVGKDGAGKGQEHLTQLQLHVLLRMVSAGLNETRLERKDPVPSDALCGEQRPSNESRATGKPAESV